jgi:hypothetical protein
MKRRKVDRTSCRLGRSCYSACTPERGGAHNVLSNRPIRSSAPSSREVNPTRTFRLFEHGSMIAQLTLGALGSASTTNLTYKVSSFRSTARIIHEVTNHQARDRCVSRCARACVARFLRLRGTRTRSRASSPGEVRGASRSGAKRTNRFEGVRRELAKRECSARNSCGRERDGREVGASFAVLQAVSDDSEGQSLHPGLCFRLGGAVRQDPRQVNDLRDPAAVDFLLKFNGECHEGSLTPTRLRWEDRQIGLGAGGRRLSFRGLWRMPPTPGIDDRQCRAGCAQSNAQSVSCGPNQRPDVRNCCTSSHQHQLADESACSFTRLLGRRIMPVSNG